MFKNIDLIKEGEKYTFDYFFTIYTVNFNKQDKYNPKKFPAFLNLINENFIFFSIL